MSTVTHDIAAKLWNLVEVWSAGKFPHGITPESLKHAHLSVQRNPIIAEVFHRAGLIEKWGRGTNRVAEMCRAAYVAPPEFAEITGAAVVTFRVPVAQVVASQQESRPESRPGLASFDVLVDMFEPIGDVVDPSAENPHKRATHARTRRP